MSATNHPPVLPVGRMFCIVGNGGYFRPPCCGIEHNIDILEGDERMPCAALQIAAWLDLRTEDDTEHIRKTLVRVGIDARKMSRHEMEELCLSYAAAWAAWEKEG